MREGQVGAPGLHADLQGVNKNKNVLPFPASAPQANARGQCLLEPQGILGGLDPADLVNTCFTLGDLGTRLSVFWPDSTSQR